MITIERTMSVNALREVEQLGKLLFEGEQNAHMFLIQPTGGISFSGYEVTARFVRADGQNVAVGGALDGTRARVVLTPSCYAVAGLFQLFIYVVSSAETVCVYACAGQVIATVGANGTAGEVPEPIIESYGGGDSRYRFEGGPNGTYDTQLGITITNDGRLYTLSGTGETNEMVSVAPLDGCVRYNNRSATVHLKKGRSYRFSLQVSRYPTYHSGGVTVTDYGAIRLGVYKGTGNGTQFITCNRNATNWDTPGNVWTYYCEQDEDVWLKLDISIGKRADDETQGYDMTGIKVLVGFGETDGTEAGHVNKEWTYHGETKLKIAQGKVLTIGATTLSEAELIALKALLS